MKKVTMLFLSLAFTFVITAQESNSGEDNSNQETTTEKEEPTRKYRSWSIGGDFGWSLLFGDFHQLESNQETFNEGYGGFDPGFSFNLQKWYSSAWGWRGRFGWQQYSGSKGIYAVQATSAFRGDFSVQLNLSGIGARNRSSERKDAWIVNAGIGYMFSNAIVYREGNEYLKLGSDRQPQFNLPLSPEERQEKSHNAVLLPFGIEWRYRLSERLDFKAALDFTWAMDDNLDGSETAITNDWHDPTYGINARNLSFSNTTNDFLYFMNIGVNYYFSFISKHEDPTPIVYTSGIDVLEQRITANEENIAALMKDEDNDGVSDYFDKEPGTPEGYMVYGGGQAVDQDKDGIPDEIDEDPFSTKGTKVDANGRELDDDGDGVPNSHDLEPNTKSGSFVNYQGVTILDKVGGAAKGSEAFLPNIYFNFNKSAVTSANYQRLATVAKFLEANPNVKLRVIGHADKVGSESYNQSLSERRAKAAINALVNEFGVDPSRLEAVAKGKSMLVSKRNDINRRVDFEVAQ